MSLAAAFRAAPVMLSLSWTTWYPSDVGGNCKTQTKSVNKKLKLLRTRLNVFVRSRSNWNLEALVFEERKKPEYAEKTSQSKGENQQQTQPTYGFDTGIWTRATLVVGKCSLQCAPVAPRWVRCCYKDILLWMWCKLTLFLSTMHLPLYCTIWW